MMTRDGAGSRGRLALLAMVAVASCGDPDHPTLVVRDSAGIEVVESAAPAWESGVGARWRVGDDALLRIGVVDGDPVYQLSMVAGAVRLADGGVAVADAGSQEVRIFGPAGDHRRTTGGTGGGPGEFTGLAAIGPAPGGGVWAYDFPLRRVTWLDRDGALVGVETLPAQPAMLAAVGALPDRSLVLRQLWGARAVAGATEQGLRRDPIAYVRLAQGALDTLALRPGREVYISQEAGRGVMSTPPFAHSSVAAVRAGRVVVGSQTVFELEEYSPEGELVRLVRLPAGDLAVTEADVEAYVDRYVQAVEPDRRPALRAQLEGLPSPATRPAHGPVLADRSGHYWVGEWTVPSEPSGRWMVLDPDGRWLGAVTMPSGFSPTDIGDGWVVGVERDEMDVEYVVVYPLRRGDES